MTNTKILLVISIQILFGLILSITNSPATYGQINQTDIDGNQSSNQQQEQQTNVTELNNITDTTIFAISEDDTDQAQQIISQLQQDLTNSTGK